MKFQIMAKCCLLIFCSLSFSASSQGGSKLINIEYYDRHDLWVIGQQASVVVNGISTSSSEFDPVTALPIISREFGAIKAVMEYDGLGNLTSTRDALGNTTYLYDWFRGRPRRVVKPDGAQLSSVVDYNGWVSQATDEKGFTTSYHYDAMGRMIRASIPADGDRVWAPTVISYDNSSAPEYGISSAHWRQTKAVGNAVTVTYYDAFLRPILVREYDQARVSETEVFLRYSYDGFGRTLFESYPAKSPLSVVGQWYEYDAIGRLTSTSQDSEIGLLTIASLYSSDSDGPYRLIVDPEGNSTTTWYQAFEGPDYSLPVKIRMPNGAITRVTRDVFGKPLSIVRQ